MIKFRQFISEERVDPKKFNLRHLYDELNRKFWNNELPRDIEVSFKGLKSRKVSGLCSAQNTYDATKRKVYLPGTGKIFVALKFFDMEKLRAIMMHEMIHLYLFVNNDFETKHDGKFLTIRAEKERLSGIKIPITDEDTDAAEYKEATKPHGFLIFEYDDGSHSVEVFTESVARQKHGDMEVKYSLYMRINILRGVKTVRLVIGTSYLSERFKVSRVFNTNKSTRYKMSAEDLKTIKVKEEIFLVKKEDVKQIDLSKELGLRR